MGKRLSSPRFRRRAAWLVAVLLLVGVITAGVALLPSSKRPPEVFTKAPVKDVSKLPKSAKLDDAGRAEVVFATSNFVKTAVRRRHVADSWALTDPSFRQGFTKRQWATGDIPVVPYPATGIRQLSIDWSYRNDVALDVVLVADARSNLPPKSFMIELKRSGGAAHHHWLVASWAPHGVSEAAASGPTAKDPGAIPAATSLSSRWLLLPLFLVLGVILTVPIALGVRERLRGARAEREHRRSSQL
jgi:hypothetical protein